MREKDLVPIYSGYKLSNESRTMLLDTFNPKYDKVIAHHITTEFGSHSTKPLNPDSVYVIGYVDSEDGIEALIVSVNGTTKRSDGSTYHITWSLDSASGKKPFDSNSVIAHNGYFELDKKIPIKVEPFIQMRD